MQHNGNNPEVVDRPGRSYSSRPLAPQGVPFTGSAGQPAAQDIFSSNKNMTGRPASTSLVLTNPGSEPLRLRVDLAVDLPTAAKGRTRREVTVPPGGSLAVPVAQGVGDRGFTAFRARVEPLDGPSRQGRLHVDVATHLRPASAGELAGQPLMPTEGERGYRVPPGRLSDHRAYVEEVRWVMKAAGVKPDPVTSPSSWPDAKVRQWVQEQQRLASSGAPNAFDPAHNRAIQGRVNGLVSGTEGTAAARPLVADRPGASTTVRLLPNREPPAFATVDGASGRRSGTALKDAGAYGKDVRALLPVTNPGTKPVTVTLTLRAPPVGEDGAQLPGHQVYNGPVSLKVDGKTWGQAGAQVRVDQPAAGSDAHRATRVATLTVPPGKTLAVELSLQVHANSQFPVDVVAARVD